MKRVRTAHRVLDWATAALVCFAIVAWGARKPWAIALFSGAFLLVLACRLAIDAAAGRLRVVFSSLHIPVFALLLLGLVQLADPRPTLETGSRLFPHTVEPYTTRVYVLLGAGYLALGLSVFHGFRSRGRVRKLLLLLFGVAVLESILGLLQSFTGFESILEPPYHSDTAHGTLANRNHYALLLNLSLAAGIGYLYTRTVELVPSWRSSRDLLTAPESPRVLWIIAWLALIGAGIMASLSRTGVVALCVSLTVMLLAAKALPGAQRTKKVLAASLCAILALALYVGASDMLQRYTDTMNDGQIADVRMHIWRDALPLVRANFLFGQGLGSFQWTFPAYESWQADTPAVYAHNDYLQLLAEMGIAGLVLVLWVLVASWKTARLNIRADDPLARGIGLASLGALSATVVQEFTDYSLYTPGVTAVLVAIVALNERVASGKRRWKFRKGA